MSKKIKLQPNQEIPIGGITDKDKLEAGLLGQITGKGDRQINNIAFIVLLLLFGILLIKADDVDLRNKIFTLVGTIMGYLFGVYKSSK